MSSAIPDFAALFVNAPYGLEALVRSALLLALTGIAALLLHRASAALRHAVWTLGLAGALVLPLLSLALPRWEVPFVTIALPDDARVDELNSAAPPPRRERAPARRQPDADEALSSTSSSAAAASESLPADAQRALWPATWQGWLAAVWFAGTLVILGRQLLGLVAVQWMARRTTRVAEAPWLPLARSLARDLGIRTPLTFLQSDRATMPMAWGLLRPSVLMPLDADTWPIDRLRIVLLHELAHVRRRDCLTHVVAQLACAVHWFNPLVWIAARHARSERERACDDLVLEAGTAGPDYAEELLAIARVRRASRFPALAANATLAMAHRTQLEGRLIAILDPKLPRSGVSRRRAVAATALCACAVLPLSAVQPWVYAAQTYEVGDSMVLSLAPVEGQQEPSNAGEPAEHPEASPDPRHSVQPAEQNPDPKPSAAPRAEPLVQAVAGATQSARQIISDGEFARTVQEAIDGALDELEGQAEPTSKKAEKVDPTTIAALTAALDDADAEVREAAMHALVSLRDPAVFEPLLRGLKHESPDIREEAAIGLGQLRDPRAIEPLMSALKDPSADVREHAAFALGQLRARQAVEALSAALTDASADVREQAAFALGQLRDRQAVKALSAALADASADVREQAAFALGQLRDPAAAEALSAALSDASADVREQALFALGQLRDPSAIDSLSAALRDESPDVREQAAFALGQIRAPRAVSPLISALKDPNADVRAQAAYGLAQQRDRAAVEALVVAMRDESAEVRGHVAFALGQIRDPRAIEALTAALKDESAEVRRHAAFALGQVVR